MFSWPDGPTFQWGERQWWRFLFYTSGPTRHAGSFYPTHTLSRVSLSLVYLRSHRMAIHTQPLAPPILMHVQLDPVVIYGVLKKVSDFLRRGAPKIPRPCVFCLDFWSVPAFVDRFHWRAGIPWGHLRGEGAWKCRSGTRCVLSLSSISAQIQNLSHLFQMEVLIWVFFCVAFAFGDLGI